MRRRPMADTAMDSDGLTKIIARLEHIATRPSVFSCMEPQGAATFCAPLVMLVGRWATKSHQRQAERWRLKRDMRFHRTARFPKCGHEA